MFNVCLTIEVLVEGEEVRLKFYREHAVQAKTIKLGAEKGEPVAVAAIVSKFSGIYVCVIV